MAEQKVSSKALEQVQQAQKTERNILLGVTSLAGLGFVVWLLAVSTDGWYSTDPESPVFQNTSGAYFMGSYGGLWQVCRTLGYKQADGKVEQKDVCQQNRLSATSDEVKNNALIDTAILDFTRTQSAFSIISFILMVMALGFSAYTFKEKRYTFKRLAGAVHFMTGATVVVVMEVFNNSVRHAAEHLPERNPPGVSWSYGASYFLGWFAFSTYVIAGCTFFVCSRKKKGKPGIGDADEVQYIGRV